MSPDPVLHLLVGPNGAGKSTFVERVLIPQLHLPRTELLAAGRSFISETVFSHPSKVELLQEAGRAGYLITLHVMIVPVDLTVARVGDRVRRGGHAVPEGKIRERYARLWAHVVLALPLVHELFVYDNSSTAKPYSLVAAYRDGQLVIGARWPSWAPQVLRTLP